ncbi:hypothetical protein [Methylomonas sp. TEB]|uniref:hypothetical protein n=1 Tax=Methylomonas sp. TEB TaxID=3398229 RepID=UPI0039F4AD45
MVTLASLVDFVECCCKRTVVITGFSSFPRAGVEMMKASSFAAANKPIADYPFATALFFTRPLSETFTTI